MAVNLSERTQKLVPRDPRRRASSPRGSSSRCGNTVPARSGPAFSPVVPIGIVLIGFHMWRTVCPLAAFSRLGQLIPRGKQRRVGAFLEKNSYLVALGTLTFSLAVRLLFTNGDGIALGVFLALISLAAFVSGAVFTGKTWCNFFCPVGIVEKIYTEPANLYAHGNSQCPKCTACKKHCPDIDKENHYWKEIDSPSRRMAYLAFPGWSGASTPRSPCRAARSRTTSRAPGPTCRIGTRWPPRRDCSCTQRGAAPRRRAGVSRGSRWRFRSGVRRGSSA